MTFPAPPRDLKQFLKMDPDGTALPDKSSRRCQGGVRECYTLMHIPTRVLPSLMGSHVSPRKKLSSVAWGIAAVVLGLVFIVVGTVRQAA